MLFTSIHRFLNLVHSCSPAQARLTSNNTSNNFYMNFKQSPAALLLALSLTVIGTPIAHAYNQPSVNLGFTSFLDGGPPAGPGFYFTQYFQYWHADSFTLTGSDDIPGDPELDAFILLSQFIYQSDQEVLAGGKWGLDVIVPAVHLDLDAGSSGLPSSEETGLGDLLVGPFIQWDPVMGDHGPIFMHRIELQMIFPTGKHDNENAANPGSNHFSFNPYWAGTLFLTPEVTASCRLHYLWNAENTDGPGGVDIQAGQAVHANFAMDYMLIPNRLRAGINGYFLYQLEDDEIDDKSQSDSKEEVWAVGPGMIYSFSQEDHIFFNLYFEMGAENRPEGTRANLRWVHHF